MVLSENALEEILFTQPHAFFPDRHFSRYARQLALGPRAGGGRIDFALHDALSDEIWLFEVKASGKMKSDVVEQVLRYLDEVQKLRASACECPFPTPPRAAVVAPFIPLTVRELCAQQKIACFEFPETMFEQVARQSGMQLTIASEPGLRLAYWTNLQQRFVKSTTTLSITPKEANNVTASRIGGLDLTLRCSTDHNCLDVDLTFGTTTAHLFPRFCERRSEIDDELGGVVLWFKQGSERHIKVQHWSDVRDRTRWPDFATWMQRQGDVLVKHAKSVVRGY